MIAKTKIDPRKRCMMAITSDSMRMALHTAASKNIDPAVLELLIREHQMYVPDVCLLCCYQLGLLL